MLPHTALQLEFARNAGMPGKTSQRGPVRFASEDALGLSWGILSATLARGHSSLRLSSRLWRPLLQFPKGQALSNSGPKQQGQKATRPPKAAKSLQSVLKALWRPVKTCLLLYKCIHIHWSLFGPAGLGPNSQVQIDLVKVVLGQ